MRAMHGVQLQDIKRAVELMPVLGLVGTMDQLAMANNVIGCLHLEKGIGV